jgi:hypothetical protein
MDVFVASAPGQIPTGDEWLSRIKRALKEADTYLILLTPISIERRWLWFETGAAWMSERRLLPVAACGLPKEQVPLPLGAHQVLSLHLEGDVKQLFRDLRLAVQDVSKFMSDVETITAAMSSRAITPGGETDAPEVTYIAAHLLELLNQLPGATPQSHERADSLIRNAVLTDGAELRDLRRAGVQAGQSSGTLTGEASTSLAWLLRRAREIQSTNVASGFNYAKIDWDEWDRHWTTAQRALSSLVATR